MDALTRLLTAIGRDLGQGLETVSKEQLARQSREEAFRMEEEAARQRFAMGLGTEWLKGFYSLLGTPGAKTLTPEEMSLVQSFIQDAVMGNLNPQALAAIAPIQSKIVDFNQRYELATSSLQRGDVEGAARILGPLLESKPDLLNTLGLGEFAPAITQAWQNLQKKEKQGDVVFALELLKRAPSDNPEDIRKFAQQAGVNLSLVEPLIPFAAKVRQLELAGAKGEQVRNALNTIMASNTTDPEQAKELAKQFGLTDSEAETVAQVGVARNQRVVTREDFQLEAAISEFVQTLGTTDEENIVQTFTARGIPEERARALAPELARKNGEAQLEREFKRRALGVSLDRETLALYNDVASQAAEAFREPPTREQARATVAALAGPVPENVLETLTDITLTRYVDRANAKATEDLKRAALAVDLHKPLALAAALSPKTSKEQFLSSLPPGLTEGEKAILLGHFEANRALRELEAPDELIKYANSLPVPLTPEALEANKRLILDKAASLGISSKQAEDIASSYAGVWQAKRDEYATARAGDLVKVGGLLGSAILDEGQRQAAIKALFPDAKDQQVVLEASKTAAQTARTKIIGESLEQAFTIAQAMAKAGASKADVQKFLQANFNPDIAKLAIAGYDDLALLASYDTLGKVMSVVNSIVSAADPQDVGRLTRKAYDDLSKLYGPAVANAASRIWKMAAQNSQKLRELQIAEAATKLEALKTDIWADKERIKIANENLKLEWAKFNWEKEAWSQEFWLKLQALAQKEEGSIKDLIKMGKDLMDTMTEYMINNGLVDATCFGKGSGFVRALSTEQCLQQIQQAPQKDPYLRQLHRISQEIVQTIGSVLGGGQPPPEQPTQSPTIIPEGQPTRPGGSAQPAQPRSTTTLNQSPPVSPAQATLDVQGVGGVVKGLKEQVFGPQAGDLSKYKPQHVGMTLALMVTEHVPGVSDNNPVQVKHQELAQKVKDCLNIKPMLERGTCQVSRLASGQGNNVAKMSITHFLPAAKNKLGLPIAEVVGKDFAQKVATQNPSIVNTVNSFRALGGKPPMDGTQITGRDIGAVYAYRTLLEYGGGLRGPNGEPTRLSRLVEEAKKGNDAAKAFLVAVAYAYTYLDDKLGDMPSFQTAMINLPVALNRHGIRLAPDNSKELINILREAETILNAENLGKLYLSQRR